MDIFGKLLEKIIMMVMKVNNIFIFKNIKHNIIKNIIL